MGSYLGGMYRSAHRSFPAENAIISEWITQNHFSSWKDTSATIEISLTDCYCVKYLKYCESEGRGRREERSSYCTWCHVLISCYFITIITWFSPIWPHILGAQIIKPEYWKNTAVKEGPNCRSLQPNTSNNNWVVIGNRRKQSDKTSQQEKLWSQHSECFAVDKESVDSIAKEKVKKNLKEDPEGV